jgi:hypothetical protein
MILFKRLAHLRKVNTDAVVANEAAKQEADRDHQIALSRLQQATEQADTLSGMNTRNHYSESLTYAFRGRTAS